MRIEDDQGNIALGGPVQEPYTPDSYLNEALQGSMQAIQSRFEQQWDIVQQNADYMGEAEADKMLAQLTMDGKNEIAQLQMKYQQKLNMMNRISTLYKQGALSGNMDKALWSIAAGDKIASQMFPEQEAPRQEKPIDPLKEYGVLSQQESRLNKGLERFHIEPAVPYDWKDYSTWGAEHTSKLQEWDPDAVGEDGKLGAWVAPKNPIKAAKEMGSMRKELDLIRSAKQRLRQSDSIGGRIRKASARLISGENPHGSIADKVNASVILRQADKLPQQVKKPKILTQSIARQLLDEAKGNKNKARELARKKGYSW